MDDGAIAGRYLLTGSATPAPTAIHSGAGRIVSVRMRPMSLAERGVANPTVSLGAMLSGEQPDITGRCALTLTEYVDEIVSSGFPGIRALSAIGRRAQLSGYLVRVMERDFPELGLRIRRPEVLRNWLTAYAAATSTTTSYNTLLGAATPGEVDKPAKTITIAYRDLLSRLWLLDPVPGWAPARGQFSRLGMAPKHLLADPALAASLLGVDSAGLLRGRRSGLPGSGDEPLLGALFESLVTLSVRVYAQAAQSETRHLRTQSGTHDVDLILERPDRRAVALEVKLSSHVDDHDVRHLLWLRNQLGEALLDAAVLTTSDRAYRRADGIGVVPAALLGP